MPILRDVQILKPIAVIVADRYSLAESASSNASLLGHIGKRSVAVVSIQRVAQRRIRRKKVALAAVHQIDVHPSIVVIVKKGASCTRGFRQIFLGRVSVGMLPRNPTGGCGNDFE